MSAKRTGQYDYSRTKRPTRKEKVEELKKEVDAAYRISRDRAVNAKLERALSLLAELE